MDSGRDVSILEDLGYKQANEAVFFCCFCFLLFLFLVISGSKLVGLLPHFFFCVSISLFGIFMPPPRGRKGGFELCYVQDLHEHPTGNSGIQVWMDPEIWEWLISRGSNPLAIWSRDYVFMSRGS